MSEQLGQAIAPDTLRLERLLPGPIERIWAYLTEGEKRAQWFAGGEMEPRTGGSMELTFDHDKLSDEKYPEDWRHMKGKSFSARVLRYEPYTALAYTFGPGPEQSEVTFELTPRGSEVLLVLTHRKIAKRDDMLQFSGGWHTHVGILEDILHDRKHRPFWTTHAKMKAEYAAHLGAKHAA